VIQSDQTLVRKDQIKRKWYTCTLFLLCVENIFTRYLTFYMQTGIIKRHKIASVFETQIKNSRM